MFLKCNERLCATHRKDHRQVVDGPRHGFEQVMTAVTCQCPIQYCGSGRHHAAPLCGPAVASRWQPVDSRIMPLMIGQAVPKVDAFAKVTGRQIYPSDVNQPNALWVQVLRAAHPHARIGQIDTSAATALPGVVCVLTARDIPGRNAFGLIVPDQPVLCDEVVRYEGDAIAVIAAESNHIARQARDLIHVDYEPLPTLSDARQALEADAIRIQPNGNLCSEVHLGTGNIEQGFAESDVIVEYEYQTGRQTHAFLETEAGISYYDNDILTICVGGQNPFNDLGQIAAALALPADRLRVLHPMMGGAFGGKEDLNVQIYLALVTLRTRRPARLALDRSESLRAGMKRHPFRVRYKTGAKRDGTLTACQVTMWADTGAYTTLGPAVLTLAGNHCCGPYRWANTKIDGYAAFTNNGNASAFRGFGNPQVVTGLEQQMDALARALEMDPLEFRRRNTLQQSEVSGAGFPVMGDVTLPAVIQSIQHSALWQTRHTLKAQAGAGKQRGVGVATIWQSYGLGKGLEKGAHTRIELQSNGRYRLWFSSPDLGEGNTTAFAQLAAETLQCGISDIDFVIGDSNGPQSGSTNASRSIFVVGGSVMNAAALLREAIVGAARKLSPNAGVIALRRDEVMIDAQPIALSELAAEFEPLVGNGFYQPPAHESAAFGTPLAFGYSGQVALVEVDVHTGQVDVLQMENHLEIGHTIHPHGAEGQSEGGIVQGLGFTLLEDIVMQDSRVKNATFSTYLIPSIRDVAPEVRTVFIETPDPISPHGGRGIGEIGLSPVPGAICNAIYDAIGVRFDRLPITQEAVQQALRRSL